MTTAQQTSYRLWDGLGGYRLVPAGTIVGCNQIGHNYSDHKVTPHCGVGFVQHWPITMVNQGRWVPLRLNGHQAWTEIWNLWSCRLISSCKHDSGARGGNPWLPLTARSAAGL